MPQQVQQKDLEEKIDALTLEIESLEQDLEKAREAKADYAHELMNDPDAQLRRIEQLAAGYQTICEFTEPQLAKITNFINIIRGLERGISDRRRSIEEIERTIAAQQKRFAAESAIEPKIEKFNECLAQLRQAWEELRSVGNEHGAEFAGQPLPEEAELYETKPKPGYSGTWLKVSFGD